MSIETKLFRLNRYLNIQSQGTALSAARTEVLRLIRDNNPITLRQLCDIQQVKMPTMSKLVDELQSAGLVIRAQSKDDGRQRWIVPTQKGLQTLASAEQATQQHWQSLLDELSEHEVEAISQSIERLNQVLANKII